MSRRIFKSAVLAEGRHLRREKIISAAALISISLSTKKKNQFQTGIPREYCRQGAPSICRKKPVVPVENQMERAFPLKIFWKKRNTFRGIPLFSFLPELLEKSLFHLIHPTSTKLLHECTGILPKNMASFVFHCPTCRFEAINADTFIGHRCELNTFPTGRAPVPTTPLTNTSNGDLFRRKWLRNSSTE